MILAITCLALVLLVFGGAMIAHAEDAFSLFISIIIFGMGVLAILAAVIISTP